MLRQQTPKPGRSRRVSVVEWLRIMMSAPLNTPALYMMALAGGSTFSAGVPYTVMRPGTREHAIARGISARDEPLRRFRGFDAGFQRIDLLQNAGGRFALDVGRLGHQNQGEQ